MTNGSLAESYVHLARVRFDLLAGLRSRGEYAVVVRMAQECVELALKAALRQVGIDPPKWHDVGQVLLDNAGLFVLSRRAVLPGLAAASRRLRKDRELAFYGDVDFVPTQEYTDEDAGQAITDEGACLSFAEGVRADGCP